MKTQLRTWLLSLILFTALLFAFAAYAAPFENGKTSEGENGTDPSTRLPVFPSSPTPVLPSSLLSDGKLDERYTPALRLGLEPYGLISWTGLNGSAELGAGASLVVGLTKNLAVVGFGEGDNTDGILIERFGGGLRYTAALGPRVSLDAGVAGAYDQTAQTFFLRLPLGASFYALQTKRADLGLRVQYAFDISGDGPNGASTGRLFLGPVLNARF